MRTILRDNVAHIVLLALPLAALACALYLDLGSDAAVAAWFKAWRPAHPLAKSALGLLTDWTNALFYLVYAAIFLHGYRTGNRDLMRLALLLAFFQIALSFGAVRILKISLGRPRPDVEGGFMFFSLKSAYNSLPSGHTAEIVGAVTPLVFWLRRRDASLGFGLLIALMAFSRIALGWHFVSDTLAGALMGVFSGLCVYHFWTVGEPEGCALGPLYQLLPGAPSTARK
jgi:undecaprenyl-diphosphatase